MKTLAEKIVQGILDGTIIGVRYATLEVDGEIVEHNDRPMHFMDLRDGAAGNPRVVVPEEWEHPCQISLDLWFMRYGGPRFPFSTPLDTQVVEKTEDGFWIPKGKYTLDLYRVVLHNLEPIYVEDR